MKEHFAPKTEYQHFAEIIYNLLVENSTETFYVGGMVRNLILQKEINDIDIATVLRPEQVKNILADNHIIIDSNGQQFGVINALHDTERVEITTFRTDVYSNSRYPVVTYTDSPESDSKRRDFTINALYLQGKNDLLLDFNAGLEDLQMKIIRFIGDPITRITEDPIRIIRGYRLADELGFTIDAEAKEICEANITLVKQVSENKIQKELSKCNAQTKKYLMHLLQKTID